MKAYLFDIDGVITNPVTRTIEHPQIVRHIVSYLEQGDLIGLISGRALSWVTARVTSSIERFILEHADLHLQILDNLFVSGEFGGVTATHNLGKRKIFLNTSIALPQQFFEPLTKVAEQFKQYVFIDTEKQTQFTLEMNYDIPPEVYKTQAKKIAKALGKVIASDAQLEVLVDRLGIPVKKKQANKHFATEQFLDWLTEKKLTPEKFYAFGDSLSDLEMGKALAEHRLSFEFIFVGEQELIDNSPFPVTVTKEHCDAGTLAYLNAHLAEKQETSAS